MKGRVIFQVVIVFVLLVFLGAMQVQVTNLNKEIKSLNDSISSQNKYIDLRLNNIKRQVKLFDTSISTATQSIVDLETGAEEQANTILRYVDNERTILKSYALLLAQTNIYERLVFIRNTERTNEEISIDVNYVEMLDGDAAEAAAIDDGDPDAASLSNNFYIREKDKTTYQIVLDPETTIYRLEGAQLIWSSLDSLLDDANTDYDGLFHVYFVDGKVVYLEEQYRP